MKELKFSKQERETIIASLVESNETKLARKLTTAACLSQQIYNALITQANIELQNCYTYMSMACYFKFKNLEGIEKFFCKQSNDERTHADKIINYIIDCGLPMQFAPIKALSFEAMNTTNIIEAICKNFSLGCEFEKTNTCRLNDIYNIAKECGDNTTVSFMKWFLDEQVEEEALFKAKLDTIALIDSGAAVMLFNEDLNG